MITPEYYYMTKIKSVLEHLNRAERLCGVTESSLRWVARKTCKPLGEGSFGLAYQCGSIVLKTGYIDSGDGYLDYIKWCKDNPCEHSPVVYDIITDEDNYYVFMEKLESAVDSEVAEDLYQCLGEQGFSVKEGHMNFGKVSKHHGQELGQFVEKIANQFKNKFHFDMHYGNVMHRRVGEKLIPVITDPIASKVFNFELKLGDGAVTVEDSVPKPKVKPQPFWAKNNINYR